MATSRWLKHMYAHKKRSVGCTTTGEWFPDVTVQPACTVHSLLLEVYMLAH
jgi:hypothetical protein